ncbi:MAG: sensor domain-containing diguanylate cyclase [Thermodesulfobacteriota bacterium]
MNSSEVFDTLNLGIVILDSGCRISYWNQWMAMHTEMSAEEMNGRCLFEAFPNLDTPVIRNSFKSVFTFGNHYFFSQKLHRYLFPIRNFGSMDSNDGYMQQSCTLSPIREGGGHAVTHVCITVQDVTDLATYESLLVEMNFRDGLTGAFNRRYLNLRMAEEIEKHRRYRRPLSLLMIDLDRFKDVNDTYGHQGGDFILKSVCATVQSELRRTDILVRYGGEEFTCLLPETDIFAATSLAERIRGRVEKERFLLNDLPVGITVSIGISTADEDGGTGSADDLLANADSGLYKAKKSGRNCVVSYR